MRAIRIVEWRRHEHADARKGSRMPWVKTPTSHDGMGFLVLMDHPDGLAHFGAWCLIMQVAANCPVRGLLVTDAGRPLLAREMALKTRGSVKVFEAAIGRLVEIGWLEWVEDAVVGDQQVSGDPAILPERCESSPATDSGDHREGVGKVSGAEESRESRMRGEREGDPPAPAPQDVPRGTIEQPRQRPPGETWEEAQGMAWVKALLRAGCRVGSGTWIVWQGLCERLGLAVVVEAAPSVTQERWPEHVERAAKTLLAHRAQRKRIAEIPSLADERRLAFERLERESEPGRRRLIAYVLALAPDHLEALSIAIERIPKASDALQEILNRQSLSLLGFQRLSAHPALAHAAQPPPITAATA